MNFHSDEYINSKLFEHLDEARQFFTDDHIVGIFLQGSQNYQLDYELSDIDTKLIVTPTFEDIVFNNKPISTTHVRENEEHIDFKDIRLYIECFKKQNINFVEILFTKYFWLNPIYEKEFKPLLDNKELIARYSKYLSLKAMLGTASEKYFALEHEYPSKAKILAEWGYDPKQLHHLLRLKEFADRYIAGEDYAECLVSNQADYLIQVKKGLYTLEEARELANKTYTDISTTIHLATDTAVCDLNEDIKKLLFKAQKDIMIKSAKLDLFNEEE